MGKIFSCFKSPVDSSDIWICNNACCIDCKECKNGYCPCENSSKFDIHNYHRQYIKDGNVQIHIEFRTNASNCSYNKVMKPYTLDITFNAKGDIIHIICDDNCYLYDTDDDGGKIITRNTSQHVDDQVFLESSDNYYDPSDPNKFVFCMWLQTLRMLIQIHESTLQ